MERLEEVSALYKELLGRDIDTSGIQTYVYSDTPIEHVRLCLEYSDERALYEKKLNNNGLCVFDITESLSIVLKEEGKSLPEFSGDSVIFHISNENTEKASKENNHIFVKTTIEVLQVDIMIEILSKMKKVFPGQKIIIISDSIVLLVSIAMLWMMLSGLDEESSKIFVLSKVDGCSPSSIDSFIGPWHLNALNDIQEV